MLKRLNYELSYEQRLRDDMKNMETNLNNAIKKNFKTVEKWKKQIEEQKEKLRKFNEENMTIYGEIKDAINSQNVKYFIDIETRCVYKNLYPRKTVKISCLVHTCSGDYSFDGSIFRNVGSNWIPKDDDYMHCL